MLERDKRSPCFARAFKGESDDSDFDGDGASRLEENCSLMRRCFDLR